MEKITPSHSLPETDVTFEACKFELLHDRIMDAATRWAKTDVYSYGEEKHTEASAYLDALMIVLIGIIPPNVRSDIYDEYYAMLFGSTPSREVSRANKDK